jgi:hypothetical protein
VRRTLTLLASAAALVVAAPLAASAKTSCNVVPDKADDTTFVPGAGAVLKTPTVDIRAIDVATGRKTVVLVLRLASTDASTDPIPDGGSWNASFAIGDVRYDFGRRVTSSGEQSFSATSGGRAIAGVKGAVTGGAVTWTAPRAGIKMLKRGSILTGFTSAASTAGFTDYAPDGGSASTAKYVEGTRSCVKAL